MSCCSKAIFVIQAAHDPPCDILILFDTSFQSVHHSISNFLCVFHFHCDESSEEFQVGF